jgi:glycerophosphoryl diester phosphodiesterase
LDYKKSEIRSEDIILQHGEIILQKAQITYIWGHRGASGYEVDNTLESFNLSIEMGADGIESDIDRTSDGHLIFWHDKSIIINGKKVLPRKLTFHQIQQINLKNERKIPEVKEIFTIFKDRKNKSGYPVRFSLDVRDVTSALLLTKIASEIGIEDRVEVVVNDNYLSSFTQIKKVRAFNSNIVLVDSAKFGLRFVKRILHRLFFQNFHTFHKNRLKAINLKFTDASDAFIEMIRKQGFQLYIWDCHDEASLKTCFKKRVDAIYTNFPDLALKIRKEIQNE